MAEPVGIVLGAVPLIAGIIKLQTLFKSIKDAPNYIHQRVVELDLLAVALRQTEDLHHRGCLKEDSIAVTRALELCHEISSDIRVTIEDLEAGLKKANNRYSWKSFKVHLQKNKVDSIMIRVHEALSFITTINGIHLQ